ncbi:hypothetical protein L9W92_05145 [Pelotomaculum terephthalicicum JT]|uniref:hypothetical protein n=1 Tax=Pelotomaculum terephthalicicum TaxID=206393 RepID=UPI0009C4A2D9|nr:hypothetical protein [Pelotomaculum terephthalicicum]MCG9967441.1 hypothetical protein [Pelotomaculum terephthalicicum JT]OPY61625.1 MAG: hypothetical protein A4E56_01926 [Pelotomaculum sp. PtaU1.Bin065]
MEKSRKNGIEVKEVIGDTAFSSIENIDYWEKNGITLIAKSNPVIATAASPKNDGFEYNKDAGTMQYPACELAMWVEKRIGKYESQVWSYYFSKKNAQNVLLPTPVSWYIKNEDL